MTEKNGRAQAMTVFTPLRPGALTISRLGSKLNTLVPPLLRPLEKLSFIHFAWWGFLTKIPENGPPQRPERLRYPYLYFETNFNGSWDSYIDAFSYVIPWHMWLAWGTSWKFPGPQPVTRFKEYIRRNQFAIDYYYAAYPEASTTMVLSALQLEKRFRAFQEETRDLGPAEFAAAYRRFVAASQKDL